MADLEQFKTVDLIVKHANDNTFIPKKYASSGDIAGRTMTLQVTDDGVVNELPGIGATATWYNRASGQTGLDAFEIVDKSKNILVWTYPQSMLTAGTVEVVISIQYQGKSTDLRKFTIEVQQVNGQMAGIVSSEAYKALTMALARVNEYDTSIAQLDTYKASKTELNASVQNLASGAPTEFFDNLATLQNKYPTGKTGTFLAKNTDNTYHVYMYDSGWKDLGPYPAQKLANNSVQPENTTFLALDTDSNLFDGTYQKITLLGDNSGLYYNDSTTALTALIKLPPRTKTTNYTVLKDTSDRFRIAAYKNEPTNGKKSDRIILISEGTNRRYNFDVSPEENFIAINVTNSNQSVNLNVGKTDTFAEGNKHQYRLDQTIIFDVDPKDFENASIPSEKNELAYDISRSNDLLSGVNFVDGKYISYSTGYEVSSANYMCTDFIRIDNRLKYALTGTTEQYAIYDGNFRYTRGFPFAKNLKDIDFDSVEFYVRFSLLKTQQNSLKLITVNPLETVDFTDDVLNFLKTKATEPKVIKVAKTGGDYSTIRAALENCSAGDTIKIGSGTWNLLEEYSEAEIKNTSFRGWIADRNLKFVGSGKYRTILYASLNANYTTDDILRVSTIHHNDNAEFSDLTIQGGNVRYACHNDASKITFSNYKNVLFKKSGAGYPQALGGGSYSGSKHIFTNCDFETTVTSSSENVPFSYHTNEGFSEPCYIELENCSFKTVSGGYDLRFGAMKSNQINSIVLKGCKASKILVKEELMNSSGFDFEFSGYANTDLTFNLKSKDNVPTVKINFEKSVVVSAI